MKKLEKITLGELATSTVVMDNEVERRAVVGGRYLPDIGDINDPVIEPCFIDDTITEQIELTPFITPCNPFPAGDINTPFPVGTRRVTFYM